MPRWFRSRKERQTELLSAYLDGRLSPKEQARAERLLRRSEEARRELESLRVTVALLRRAPAARPPRSFALTPEMVRPRVPSRVERMVRWTAPAAVAAAAMFLAFALVGGSVDLFRSGPPVPAAGEPPGKSAVAGAQAAPTAAPMPTATQAPQATPTPAATPAPVTTPGGKRSDTAFQASGTPGPQGPAGPAGAAGAPQATATAAPSPAPTPTAASQAERALDAAGQLRPAGPGIPPPGPAASGSSFPWLALQLAAGGLTGVAIVAALWQYRRSRSRV